MQQLLGNTINGRPTARRPQDDSSSGDMQCQIELKVKYIVI